MREEQSVQAAPTLPQQAAPSRLRRVAKLLGDTKVPFTVRLPDGTIEHFGSGAAKFQVVANNQAGVNALLSLDAGRFGDAFVTGDVEVDGDILQMFALKGQLRDFHPLITAWRFLQPLLMGQVHTNKAAIAEHYEFDPAFYLSFLDPITPCYTQGIFHSDNEPLDVATTRKFDYVFEKLGLKAGDHILEVGPGWGAWFAYASARGVKCTGLTIAQSSADFLAGRAKELGYDWEIILSDVLEFPPTRQFDAIVMMGVIEHLPDYDRILAKFDSLLKPGGRIFLDGSACARKYELASFITKYIYPGNHCLMVLHDFLGAMARSKLAVEEIFNDRHSYYLTFRQWAINFDSNREAVIEKFGAFNFRRFRLYLWGCAYEFLSRGNECYRLILHKPEPA